MFVDVAIRSRHMELPEDVRDTVEEKLTRVGRFLDGMERVDVKLFEQRVPRSADREVCEVTMQGHGHVVRAHAAGPDVVTAVDRVIDKLEHRLTRLKGRLVSRSHPRRSGSVSFRADHTLLDDDTEINDDQPRIVKTKHYEIKPMTPDEAALQMELLGHDFFFFMNADTSQAAVVYHRTDGDVGLIDAT
jgi:putative sigma-54 modulation protein